MSWQKRPRVFISVLQPRWDRVTRWDLTFFIFSLSANCYDRNRRPLWLLATPTQSCADPKGWPSDEGGSGMMGISERPPCCVNTTKKEANFPPRDLLVICKEVRNTRRHHLTAEIWQIFLSLFFRTPWNSHIEARPRPFLLPKTHSTCLWCNASAGEMGRRPDRRARYSHSWLFSCIWKFPLLLLAQWLSTCSRFHAAHSYCPLLCCLWVNVCKASRFGKECAISQTIKRLKLCLLQQNCSVYVVLRSMVLWEQLQTHLKRKAIKSQKL